MKEHSGKSLEELEKLYEALLEGQDDPDGTLLAMLDQDLEDFFHPVEGLCSVEDFLKCLTPHQQEGLLEEYEDLEEGDFQDPVFLAKVKERLLDTERITLTLIHVEEASRVLFASLASKTAPMVVTGKQVRALLLPIKAGLVCCYKKGTTYEAFVAEEVKAAYGTLSQNLLEKRAQETHARYVFALAAVHLYGIISLDELVELFLHYHPDRSATEKERLTRDFEATLENFIPSMLECELHQGYVMAEFFVEDSEGRKDLLQDQQGKPRYIPETLTAYLRYQDESYFRSNPERKAMEAFFQKIAQQNSEIDQENLEELMLCISYEQKFSIPVENTLRTIAEMGFMPNTGALQEEMIDCLIPMEGFCRKWEHKGYSSNELHQMNPSEFLPPEDRRPLLPTSLSGGPSKNGPCPCGSGKKFKRCCMK